MKKFLSPRSPIWQITIYAIGFSFFAYVTYLNEHGLLTDQTRQSALIWE